MVLAAHPNADAPVLSHFSLAGKNAIVTGGSKGIGFEIAKGLLEAGASVAITYASTPADEVPALLEKLSESVIGHAKVMAYQCKVNDKASVISVVDKAADDFGGRLDIVVANAGIAEHSPAEDYPEDRFRTMFDVNLSGAFWTAQAAANVMKKTPAFHRGSIIFTCSVSATLVNIPQKQSAYNASKAAVLHLAKSLAVEWVDFARVNCVSPGYIATDMLNVHPTSWRAKWLSMIPGGRLCQPAELKGCYVFLASDASSYMTGGNVVVDGGYNLP